VADLDNLGGVASVPTFNAARVCMGAPGLAIMTVTALAAIFTGIIGAYRAALRVLSTMAEDHILSEKFARTEYGIVFIMVISVLLSMLGRNTLDWFVDLTAFGAIIGFGYTSAAAWKTGRMESNRRAVAFGIAGTAISAAFAVVQLVPRLTALEAMGSEAFLLLGLWCLLGFIFYLRTVNETTLAEFTGMSTSGVALFALLLYSALMWLAKRLAASGDAAVRDMVTRGGVVVMLIVFVGLAVMMYIQNLIRKKHEVIEREKIRAVEDSLAKSQFLFNMFHDIRTPMNAIIGYTTLARQENDPAVLHDYLGKIDTSSHHLLTLINDILEMSRIESGTIELEFVPTDLPALFEEIHDLFAEQMRQKGLEFNTHTSQVEDRYAWCDKKNLTRVLLNVVSNAWNFTPGGGTVSMSLWEDSGEDGYGSYELRVRDSGIGMSQAFVEKMFNAFERERTSTDSGVEGTGLGLAITKQMVELMNGAIECQSAVGKGTTFTVSIDIAIAERQRDDLKLEPMDILVVDDDEILLDTATDTLRSLGAAPEVAGSGLEALGMIARRHEQGRDYAVVIVDWKMPGMDGVETVQRIREEVDARIPILLVSAYDWSEVEDAARAAGADGFITKPLFRSTLYDRINQLLGTEVRSVEPEDDYSDLAGMRILVAEDNEVNWEIISAMLGMFGIETERAVNGRVCVDMMRRATPGQYALIFMDVQMPEMNGLDATRQIRQLGDPWARSIPIVAMTADAFSENVTACLDAGMNGHIAKPVDLKLVIKEIRRVKGSRA